MYKNPEKNKSMKDRWMDQWTDGRTNGPTDGQTDRPMDRRMDRQSMVHGTKKIRVKKKREKNCDRRSNEKGMGFTHMRFL